MKRIICFLLVFIAIFSSTAATFAVDEELYSNDMLFISNDNSLDAILSQRNWDTLSTNEMINADISEYRNIVISFSDLNTTLKSKIVSQFENMARIIVLGEVTHQAVRSYFGVSSNLDSVSEELPENSHSIDSSIISSGNSVDISSFDTLGVLIYRTANGVNVTKIKIEDSTNKIRVAEGLEYCLSYDYFALVNSNATTTRSGGYTNTWINVDVNTYTHLATRCTINTSIKIDKNSGNPNSNNEYLQYTPYIVDIDVVKSDSNVYSIHKVEVEVKGSSSSLIYDYGPLNQSCGASASVSFGLPYSISVSFTPGSNVGITRSAGGINSNSVKIKYQIKSPAGLNGYEYDGVRCEAHIESYQRNNRYLYGYGQFNVYTYVHSSYSGEPSNLIRYYNSVWDTGSGS